MALSNTQVRQLRAKLEAKHVKTRKANGADLHYVEGWHVIAEANRIFGYDAWDRRTLASRCVCSGANGAYHEAAYTAKVRVSVRAGDITIVREGSGSGEAKGPTPGQAHELALKGAETDATKRALATFGNPFGLALYDREQIGVRKARGGKAAPAIGPWLLRSASGSDETSFDQPSAFAAALRQAMSEARDIELLFAIWEQNVETVRALNRSLKQDSLPRSGIAPQLVAHLKHCAVALVKPENRARSSWRPCQTSEPTTVPAQRSTRACSPSANQNGFAPRSICALSPSSPALFAADRRATPITSVSPNRGVLGSRSAMNSRYPSAPSTISRTTRPAMSGYGGRSRKSTRSQWQSACGKKASKREHPATLMYSTNAAKGRQHSQILLCKQRAHANASRFNHREVSDPICSFVDLCGENGANSVRWRHRQPEQYNTR